MESRFKRFISYKNLAVTFILIIVFLLAAILHPRFLTLSNLINILQYISITGVLAIGVTIVLIGGEIDISVASIAAFTAAFGAVLSRHTESNFIIIILPILLGAILGFINGMLIKLFKIPSFVLTLAMYIICRAAAIGISKGIIISLREFQNYLWIGQGSLFGFPAPVIVLFTILTATFLFLKFTVQGKALYLIGANKKVSELSGINVNKWKVLMFVLSGVLAAIAGLMAGARLGQVDPQQIVQGYEMTAIAIAILGGASLAGGRGSILGTIQAAAILGILINLQNLVGLSAYYQSVIIGFVLILVVIVNEVINMKRGESLD